MPKLSTPTLMQQGASNNSGSVGGATAQAEANNAGGLGLAMEPMDLHNNHQHQHSSVESDDLLHHHPDAFGGAFRFNQNVSSVANANLGQQEMMNFSVDYHTIDLDSYTKTFS